jgi:hypothetical protein
LSCFVCVCAATVCQVFTLTNKCTAYYSGVQLPEMSTINNMLCTQTVNVVYTVYSILILWYCTVVISIHWQHP